ncbi:Wall-associated receptor kinase-like, partial [Thalictrum thalictroides]
MISKHGFMVLVLLLIILSLEFKASALCQRLCGDIRLPYPFGFSEDCEIRLSCSESREILIGEFKFHNLTSDNLIVNIPAECNRPIETLSQLVTPNYAISTQNGILLGNCNSMVMQNDCIISNNSIQRHFELQECSGQNVSCYSKEDKEDNKFLSWNELNQSGCNMLFSSVALDDLNKGTSMAVEFQKIQLGWWLKGNCKCSDHTTCTNFTVKEGLGYRCKCNRGYVGDGFSAGVGCRK